jgi:2Fe-2S ferredoxin
MPKITFVQPSGETQEVDATTGVTIMEAAVDAMVPGIEADCGGNCICATCHVYVEKEWLSKLPDPEGDEEAMIDYTADPQDNSRLTCQLQITDELDGIVLHVPESQY